MTIDRNWDLGHEVQGFARPHGAERSLVNNAESKTLNVRPREPQPAPKKKAKEKKPPKKEEKKEEIKPRRKRKRGAATLKRSKDENKEVVNAKPAEPEPDAEEDDAPVEEEAPLEAVVEGAPAAVSEKASTEPMQGQSS